MPIEPMAPTNRTRASPGGDDNPEGPESRLHRTPPAIVQSKGSPDPRAMGRAVDSNFFSPTSARRRQVAHQNEYNEPVRRR